MRCSSCGARVDPTRSFCQHCGSAVFLDDATFVGRRLAEASATAMATAPAQAPRTRVSTSEVQRAARRTAQAATATSAAGAGCLGALVRWAIAFALIYWVVTAIGGLPEVREAIAGLARGEQVDLQPATNAIRSLFGIPPAREQNAPQRRPSGQVAPRDLPPPGSSSSGATGGATVPQGDMRVYEFGQPGVTAPALTTRVPAAYSPEALRQGIQGTVLLRCIVEPDGTVSAVTVTRSIDSRYGLDEEAVKAVKQWRFLPGRRDGVPVRVAIPVSVAFTLRGRGDTQSAR